MTVCQFFLQGRCRFGQNCRYEHSYNNDDRNIRSTTSTQQLSNVIRQIVGEVILAEKGGQWPLSCFAPVKEGANIPGWVDVSPEEVRWKMYEARVKGTLTQCLNEINQLYSNAEKNRNALKQPTIERINLIVNVLKGKKDQSTVSNPFTGSSKLNKSNFEFESSHEHIFDGSKQTSNQGNIFGNITSLTGSHGNIFGGSLQSTGSQGNIFGGNSSSFPNQNIFTNSGLSNSFNQNIFSNVQPSNQNIFSNSSAVGSSNIFPSAAVLNQNLFSSGQTPASENNQNPSVFSSSASSGIFSNQGSSGAIFGSQNAFFQKVESKEQNHSNVFGGSPNENFFNDQNSFPKTSGIFNSQQQLGSNTFGSEVVQQTSIDSSVYSKVEDLNEEDLKSFAAATFIFGKIPLKPPPQEYCK